MSVYASLPAPEARHSEGCGAWVEFGDGIFDLGDEAACTCGLREGPIVYRGSHIVPRITDTRDGWIDLAAIPGYVTRDGRDDGPEDEDTAWPFLRFGVNGETVVLDRAGVEVVHRTLTRWLEQSA